MRWLYLGIALIAAPAGAVPLEFSGITAGSDVRYTRALACLNYFGNKDYRCKFSRGTFGDVSVRNSLVWFNKATFRPYSITLFLNSRSENSAAKALVAAYGSPSNQGVVAVVRAPKQRGRYTSWAFDSGASLVLLRAGDHLSLIISFPENET
jgi:hypothetical protein